MQKMLVRVAVVQAGSILFDRDRTIEKASDFARDAAARGAELVVFPEAFIGGYPKGFDFGARVGSRSAEGREQFREYFDGALEIRVHLAALSQLSHGVMGFTWSSV